MPMNSSTIARLEVSATNADTRALREMAREYDGMGETPAQLAAHWSARAAKARELIALMHAYNERQAATCSPT